MIFGFIYTDLTQAIVYQTFVYKISQSALTFPLLPITFIQRILQKKTKALLFIS